MPPHSLRHDANGSPFAAELLTGSEFVDQVGLENILPNIEAALARARDVTAAFNGMGRLKTPQTSRKCQPRISPALSYAKRSSLTLRPSDHPPEQTNTRTAPQWPSISVELTEAGAEFDYRLPHPLHVIHREAAAEIVKAVESHGFAGRQCHRSRPKVFCSLSIASGS
jgi:hypothetical protein